MFEVLIPFRPESKRRAELYSYVTEWWHHHFPLQAVVRTGDSGSPDFDRSASRNAAFAQSSSDVLVVADADTIPNSEAVAEAVDLVRKREAPWIIPYAEDRYYNLSEAATDRILTGRILGDPMGDVPEPAAPDDWEHKITSWAGCLVLPRFAWEAVGGYDERFKGWGFEDNAFRLALDRLWGEHERMDSYVLHLWHERGDASFDQPHIESNRRLFKRYQNAGSNTELLRVIHG